MTEIQAEEYKRRAQDVFNQLEDISENGLHRVYDSFEDYLYDMYPNLPWNPEGGKISIKIILNNPNFYDVAMKILDLYGFNMLLDFGKVINQIDLKYSR